MRSYVNKSSIFIAIILLDTYRFVQGGIHQKKLLADLFKNYNPTERPVEKETDFIDLEIGLSVVQINDIDEKQQIIKFSGWLDMSWHDTNLKWNPVEYGNITVISMLSSRVWVPDIILYSSADDSFDPTSPVNLLIDNTGMISYLPPGMFKSNCIIEIYEFPFDEQVCTLKFGSWTLETTTVDMKNKSSTAQLDSYVANGEWHLSHVVSYPKRIKYECCPQIYPFVMFDIHLRRRTLYFIFNFVFPCVLISFMSILGFCLPPDSGEKIGLEMTTLLSIIMFSQLITGIIPESSISVPKISLYFSSITIICTLCIVVNVLVLILHHRNIKIQEPMPDWIDKWICGYLAQLLRMKIKKPEPESSSNDNHKGGLKSEVNNEASSKSLLANVLDINDDYFNKNNNKFKSRGNNIYNDGYPPNAKPSFKHSQDSNQSSDEDYSHDTNPIKRNLGAILKELKVLTQKIEDDDADDEKVLNWKFAAMVVDRLCMILFSLATFLCTFFILLTSKNFFKFQ